jgi:hypothetical protein
MCENSTGGKPGVTRTSHNPFETSRSEKSQYFVDVVMVKHEYHRDREGPRGISTVIIYTQKGGDRFVVYDVNRYTSKKPSQLRQKISGYATHSVLL